LLPDNPTDRIRRAGGGKRDSGTKRRGKKKGKKKTSRATAEQGRGSTFSKKKGGSGYVTDFTYKRVRWGKKKEGGRGRTRKKLV